MGNNENQRVSISEIRIIGNSFNVHDQLYDLILQKSGEIFSIHIKGTQGRIYFHEQEIAEQMGIQDPTLDHLTDFIFTLYNIGLNPQRNRDFQLKLLVEGCPAIFKKQNYLLN